MQKNQVPEKKAIPNSTGTKQPIIIKANDLQFKKINMNI